MPVSLRWSLAGLGFCAAAFACTLKARQEMNREKDDETWRETVEEMSDTSESSSSQSSQPPSSSS